MKRVSLETLTEEARYLRLMLYGESGVGKTWFCASAALDPATSPVLFLEFRSQVAALRARPEFVQAIQDGNLVILSLGKYEELNQVYAWLSGRANPQLDELFEGGRPKTVVVDSLTELQRSEVMRRAGNLPDKFITDVEPPQIQDWGTLLNQFTLLAHLFYQLPYHIVFAVLEKVDFKPIVGQPDKIVGYRPALQGQAARQFPAYALTLMRLERAAPGAPVFNTGTTSARKAHSKDQTGFIPKTIPGPTLPMLVKMIAGKEA